MHSLGQSGNYRSRLLHDEPSMASKTPSMNSLDRLSQLQEGRYDQHTESLREPDRRRLVDKETERRREADKLRYLRQLTDPDHSNVRERPVREREREIEVDSDDEAGQRSAKSRKKKKKSPVTANLSCTRYDVGE